MPRRGGQSGAEAAQLELGARVYQQQCAACHGPNLEGQPNWQQPLPDGMFRAPPHDETGHTWHHDDAYLLERTRSGSATLPAEMRKLTNMPAFEDVLSEAEIQAVIAYIKSTWPADIRQMQSER